MVKTEARVFLMVCGIILVLKCLCVSGEKVDRREGPKGLIDVQCRGVLWPSVVQRFFELTAFCALLEPSN